VRLAPYEARCPIIALPRKASQDLEDAERKISCRVLSLWGADFGAVGNLFDMKMIWSEMAENLSVAPIERCDHLPQEERPEVVNGLLLDFLRGWNGS
jgi:haloacetate dehalogenase